jgi:hypothetical protein
LFNGPHASVHLLTEQAVYMEISGAYLKRHPFTTLSRLIARIDHGKRRQAAAPKAFL